MTISPPKRGWSRAVRARICALAATGVLLPLSIALELAWSPTAAAVGWLVRTTHEALKLLTSCAVLTAAMSLALVIFVFHHLRSVRSACTAR